MKLENCEDLSSSIVFHANLEIYLSKCFVVSFIYTRKDFAI